MNDPAAPDIATQQADNAAIAKRLTLLVALVFVLVAVQAWQAVMGLSVRLQRWEYAIEAPPDTELPARLRALGNEGWDIVSARRATSDQGGRTVGIYEMIVRRPASDIGNALPIPVPKP